jgi:hypothetical protein
MSYSEEDLMNRIMAGKVVIILKHAFIVWAICGAIMGIGMGVMDLNKIILIHAIAAPVVAGLISLLYFKKFNYTSPLLTAFIFLAFVMFMDFFIVALLIMKSFEMFRSISGTWIPFVLIFISTFLTGLCAERCFRKSRNK